MAGYAIIAAEVSFWLLVGAGLLTRYALRLRKLGLVLLACTPLVDVALLCLVTIDLLRGGTATGAHAIAGVYIGVSISFGHQLISWADAQVSYRFAGGPKPPGKPKKGPERSAYDRQMWIKHARAWAIGSGVLLICVAIVSDASRTESLLNLVKVWSVILAIDAAFAFARPTGSAN